MLIVILVISCRKHIFTYILSYFLGFKKRILHYVDSVSKALVFLLSHPALLVLLLACIYQQSSLIFRSHRRYHQLLDEGNETPAMKLLAEIVERFGTLLKDCAAASWNFFWHSAKQFLEGLSGLFAIYVFCMLVLCHVRYLFLIFDGSSTANSASHFPFLCETR